MPPIIEQALISLVELGEDVDLVEPTTQFREHAGRLLRVHPLRAADALQLAATHIWCEGDPSDQAFVAVDRRLREAASREGFIVAPA